MVMGVSGVGKTTIGRALADRIGWTFIEADDDHSPENVAHMHAGIPLTDEDRKPWLDAVGRRVRSHLELGEDVVLACSALKDKYREQLRAITGPMTVIYLSASREVIAKRLAQRHNHFMNATLLGSQIDTLEPPRDAITVDASGTPDQVVDLIVDRIRDLSETNDKHGVEETGK
jgi:gluconokinase